MNAQELLMATIADVLGEDVPVYATRGEQTDAPTGRALPSVVWVSLGGEELPELLDAPGERLSERFEVRTRSKTCEGAQTMAADIIGDICGDVRSGLFGTSRLLGVTADFDEPDNPDQQRGKFFEHVIEVEISQ